MLVFPKGNLNEHTDLLSEHNFLMWAQHHFTFGCGARQVSWCAHLEFSLLQGQVERWDMVAQKVFTNNFTTNSIADQRVSRR